MSRLAILIVGAGFTGAVMARQLADNGYTIHVIDKRNHIAGNAFDYENEHGIRIHAYGPHLFHTNNENVFAYLSRFTEWTEYKHKVKAQLSDGSFVPFPPNQDTLKKVPQDKLMDTFYRPYTKKMWGIDLEQLDSGIINRVPIRDDDNDFYFPNDIIQALPNKGYTELIKTMLAHQNISVDLDTCFDKTMEADYSHSFNCMPIDEYYDYRFGKLPYRSIKFKHQHYAGDLLQPAAVVNFTTPDGATRKTEWKHLPNHCTKQAKPMTTITSEYPCDYTENNLERYYPIKDVSGANRAIYKQYNAIANPKTTFVGRCGKYVYIDMHQAINMALTDARQFIDKTAK